MHETPTTPAAGLWWPPERQSFLGYWPEAADEPDVAVGREPLTLISPDGAVIRGILWTPPAGTPWRHAVVLTHPRGDFSTHYACPLLAAAGYAAFGFGTRYVNNDTDCQHELAAVDVETAVAAVRAQGAETVTLLGNSGGGSLMAEAQARAERDGRHLGDAFIALAAHPGEGVFMLQVIDPSVTDEADPFSCDPSLDMFHPDNGWRPFPEASSYDPAWVERYRAAQRDRVARIDAIARSAIATNAEFRTRAREAERGSTTWNHLRRRAVFGRYLTIYRTLADPAHLDPEIAWAGQDAPAHAEPGKAPGTIFAFPDPLDANYGSFGLGRVMTPRGWLSTWSGLSSHAAMATNLPDVTVPTLVLHPTGDTEIRVDQATALADASGADDVTYAELPGAPHYLEGHRPAANEVMVSWLDQQFGSRT